MLGPGEEMAHLATVALALGVASPGRKGTASSAAADPLGASSSQDGNGYLISDWGDFH